MDSDIEQTVDQLKKTRSIAKGNVTRKANKVNEILTSCDNVDTVKEAAEELDEALNHFKVVHEDYHSLLEEEHDLKESDLYFNSVSELVLEHQLKIRSWLKQPTKLFEQENQNPIQPEDSISTAGSRKSSRSQARSIATSIKSSTSARARAAAKQAALEAKANALHELHELQLEELKIKQKKSQIELQAEIAAVEAEKQVYEQSEASVVCSDQSVRSRRVARTSVVQIPANKPVPYQPNIHTVRVNQKQNQSSNSQQLNPYLSQWLPGKEPVHQDGIPITQDHSFQQLIEAQDRQATVLQQLVQQQMQGVTALTLPQPTIKVFKGDPIQYCDFVRSFEHVVERKTPSPSSRLYYLVQYTTGPVQDLMKSCLSMDPEKGYVEAKRLLKERYGQDFRIAAAHISQLTEGLPIKAEDGNALLQFSIQLTSCTNTLKEIGSLTKLDHPDNLKKIINRLPFGMRLKWRDVVDRIVAKEGRDVTINDVTEFVTVKARAATHPIFGRIVNDSKAKQDETKVKRPHGGRANGFATQGDLRATEKGQENRSNKNTCPCNENHWLARCDKFRKMTPDQRMEFVKKKGLCLNCFTTGHFVRSCPKASFCKVQGCAGKHSTFLHPKSTSRVPEDNKTPPNQITKGEPGKSPNSVNNGYVRMSTKPDQSMNSSVTGLAVVPVRVRTKGRPEMIETYAFLDSGSNTTFCTEGLLKKLNYEGRKTKLSLTTMLGEGVPVECSVVELEVFDLDTKNRVDLPKVYSTKSLPIRPECIGRQEDIDRWPHLKGVTMRQINAEIGLLVGSDVPEMLQPKEIRISEDGGPFATKTLFGWVLNGPLGREDVKDPTVSAIQANSSLEQRFEQFCNMEFNDLNYDSQPSMSQNDKRALNLMEESVKLVNGHYEIGLPWEKYPPCLSNNVSQARQRLRPLKKRLQQDRSLLEKYKRFMEDLVLNDYARKATTQDVGPLKTHWYLPHHPVFHPQKPDKVRVVFDCSAKYRDTSLNDQLLQGPDLTNTLVGVLTRFREEPIAMMADVEAMFYQVRVPSSDCDALRFLWWPEGDLSKEPEEYEMRVHLFGGASSPSCANFALRRTAKDNEADFDSKVIETVTRNFYVDDCLKSVRNEEEAVVLAKQLRELLARGGFKLTKWLSNSRKVVEAFPESERASIVKNLDFNNWSVERALGVQWNISSDKFGFKIAIKDRPPTRRGILSTVSSVYDPLGFAAPFLFKAKLILQDLCRMKLDWDERIPEEYVNRWKSWLEELLKLEEFAVERCFRSPDLGEIKTTQLHHFADASQDGYGAVSYLRVVDESNNVKVSFVMGKSRLAPIKTLTIPRMELSAAVLATKLDRVCRRELSLPINQSFFWTDSTCVLRYIANKDKRFHIFVANRVAAIHNASSPSQWHYVNTELNPADDASRGVEPNALERWIRGPEFLLQSAETWPKRPAGISNTDETDSEVKKPSAYSTMSNERDENPLDSIIERCSSWDHLRRKMAWILRYKAVLQRQNKRRKRGESTVVHSENTVTPINVEELQEAEYVLLKHIQSKCFKDEHQSLCEANDNTSARNARMLKRSSKIFKLDPVLKHGRICVGGRLGRAPIGQQAKHPVILPKSHHVVTLVVNHYHKLSGHSGLEYTLSLIRQRYWIIDGRRTVRRVLDRCIGCKKRQAPVGQQKMADLPRDRTTPSRPPFTFTGVDCFGPFDVRRGRVTVKRYGVLFTCLTTRAIHLEVASSLDTCSFINALRRFISRRGQPEEVRSDNGGNFVKGEKDLRKAVKKWNQSQISDCLLQKNVKWTFNPPTGSHHGGVWERCIRTTRKVIKAVIREQILDDEGINTLMCEVEAIVNGRPITKLSDDPRDMEPLTPNHLLLLRAGPMLPPTTSTEQDAYCRRWRQVQYLADLFWRRWIKEYLPSLQVRQKWNKRHRNFVVNDIVLIMDDKTPRNFWPLGRVLEVYTNNSDGLVRSVKLKTKTGELTRPVNKIVLLEGAGENQNDK